MNKDCKLKPYCSEDCATCTDEYKAKKIALMDAIRPTLIAVSEALAPILRELTRTAAQVHSVIIKSYPDKRVAYLALHHRKRRVRKKNQRRIENDIRLTFKRMRSKNDTL